MTDALTVKDDSLAALVDEQGVSTLLKPLIREIYLFDSYVAGTTHLQDASQPVPAWRSAMDVVLADVPCSGLGVIRKKPDIRYHEPSAELPALQRAILAQQAEYVRPGGVLLYSTCTILPEENEGVIAAFLSRRGDYRLAGLPESIPPEMQSAEGFFKTRTDLHGTDGFFGAVLRRRS